MSNDLLIDLETFNETPIMFGAHRYAQSAEVMLVAWAWDDEPADVWDTRDRPHWRSELQEMIDYADRTVIHNSAFDRVVLEAQGVHIPVDKIEDTMVLALTHGLPAKLEMLGSVLGLPEDKAKDKDGKRLIHLFTKPRPKNTKLRRATRETHPDDWQRFISYAGRDVDAMRSIRGLLPRWNWTGREGYLWALDQAINDRGVAVDLDLADAAVRAFQRDSRRMDALAAELTGGEITSLTQRGRLMEYLRGRGIELPDLTKGTIEATLRDGNLPSDVLELLELRRQGASTTPSKYQTLRDAAVGGRMRGTVQFRGAARTGRDAGRIFQPQNLARCPDWFDGDVQELTILAFKDGCEDILFDDVADRCVYAVRGSLVADEGKKLLIADLSNIEGRVLAWLARELWKIEAFKAYDRGEGPDLYKVTAGRILGKNPYDVTKPERQLQGKVPELAGGYGGGIGAYRVMGGAVFDAMSDEEIQDIVWAWRKQHPATTRFWYAVEGAFRSAIRAERGEVFEAADGLLRFDRKAGPDGVDYVRIKLPSGRYLSYRNARINEDSQIIYEGLNQYTRKWEDIETYYGKIVENIVQAVACDVFHTGMILAERAGYPVVLRVHDELVCEVPNSPEFTVEALCGFMSTLPSWAAGLPLAAAGFEALRYRKE
jgi:DNA polymerase bacteriophage-type